MYIHVRGKCYPCLHPGTGYVGAEGNKIRVTVNVLRRIDTYKVHLKFLVLILKSVDGKMSGHFTPEKNQGDCFFSAY